MFGWLTTPLPTLTIAARAAPNYKQIEVNRALIGYTGVVTQRNQFVSNSRNKLLSHDFVDSAPGHKKPASLHHNIELTFGVDAE